MRRFTVALSVSNFQRMPLSALRRYFRGAAILTRHLKPLDCALTCTGVAAATPVIGRYLEPLGTLVAVGAWVRRNAPGSAAWVNGAAGQVSGRRRIRPKAGELQALTDVALAGLVAPDLPGRRGGRLLAARRFCAPVDCAAAICIAVQCATAKRPSRFWMYGDVAISMVPRRCWCLSQAAGGCMAGASFRVTA